MSETLKECSYCHGVGACPKCWGRAGIEALTKARDTVARERDEHSRCAINERTRAMTAESALASARSERDALQERVEAGVREWDKERAEHVNDVACGERRLLKVEAERDAARSEVARYREREELFAKALAVADGGQYRADWDGAIARVVARASAAEATAERLRAEMEELRALVAKLGTERDDADRRAAENWGRALKAERALAASTGKEPDHE